MIETDTLQRFIFENAAVRGEFIHLSESFQTIINQHNYPPAIKRLLGEALCIAGLLSAIIKFEGRLTVQFRGSSGLKMLLAQCNNEFQLRGLVSWEGEMDYEALMQSFNDGVLVIMLDSGVKGRYQGIVGWEGNSLIDSVQNYFRQSEQLSTKLYLAVNENSAAGLLVQAMPLPVENSSLEAENIDWYRLASKLDDLQPDDILEKNHIQLLEEIYPGEDIRVFDAQAVEFKCTCSRKRGEGAILVLGQAEAMEELKEKQIIVVTCDFCNQVYEYNTQQVQHIFANDQDPPDSHTLH